MRRIEAVLTQIINTKTTSPTLITLTSNTNSQTSSQFLATFGQTVTFTATVSPCCIATGTVTFFDANATLGSAALVSQDGIIKASFSSSALSVGTHAITARYSGDLNSSASTSVGLTETIWAISLTSSPNPAVSGQTVTFTACSIPTGLSGVLAFLDGTTTIGVNNNVLSPCSSYSTNILTVGTHSMTARYSDSYGGNTSGSITQTVTKAPTTPTTITLTPTNPTTYSPGADGTAIPTVVFTATVSSSNATGLVKFFMTNSALGCSNSTCEIMCYSDSFRHSLQAAPKATCWYYPPAGTFTITAVYSGRQGV